VVAQRQADFTPPTFDSINGSNADGNEDDYLSLEEVKAWFANGFAGRAGGGGAFDAEAIFAQWDTLPEGAPDGKVTRQEFDARPVGAGRGRAGPGGGAPPR